MWNLVKFIIEHFKFWPYLVREARIKRQTLAADFNEMKIKVLGAIQSRHRKDVEIPVLKPEKSQVKTVIKRLFNTNYVTASILQNTAFIYRAINKTDKNIFYVHGCKIGYIRIPKSASTSILSELLKLKFPGSRYNLSDIEINVFADHLMEEKVKSAGFEYFTVVRNPFSRILSVYRSIFNQLDEPFLYHNYLFGILSPSMSFSEFIKKIYCIPDLLKDQHFKPQYSLLSQHCSLEKIKILKIEEIGTGSISINGVSIQLPFRNKGSDPRNFSDTVTKKTYDLIQKIYQKDFETFNY